MSFNKLNIDTLSDVKDHLHPSTFQHKNKNIVMLVYSRECGACHAMMPEWNKVNDNMNSNYFSNNETCCLMKVEAHTIPEIKKTNEQFYKDSFGKMRISHVPTIAMLDLKEKPSISYHEDERDSIVMTDKFNRFFEKSSRKSTSKNSKTKKVKDKEKQTSFDDKLEKLNSNLNKQKDKLKIVKNKLKDAKKSKDKKQIKLLENDEIDINNTIIKYKEKIKNHKNKMKTSKDKKSS